MNKGRKIKHSLLKNEEPETATTTTTTKTKLLTPCRRVGLNRKRKNILSGSCSSSELNISSPNVSLTEIDISVKDHDDSSTPSITNKIEVETPVLTNPPKPRKNRLGASRKRPQTVPKTELTPTLEELTKKYNICDVSVVLTRCDVDKYIINRNTEPPIDISAQIENEAISSTPELQETHPESSEIQTNQISTTIEDLTPIVDHQKTENNSPNKSAPSSAKIKDLFGDSDDSDFDFKRKKRKRFSAKPPPANNSTSNSPHLDNGSQNKKKPKKSSKKTDSQNESDEIPENTIPRKKRKRSSSHNKKSPKRNKLSTSKASRFYNSDSDDDFMEKPRRDKKDPDIKKKINIPVPDPLNRTEHIRIRENKSYTIMHMNNISSYVKYYDNDVNLKRTESDDNQQTNSQPVVSNVRTSMILERKDYLADKGSQETDQNKPSDSQDSPALEPVISVSENPVLESVSVSENPALEAVSVSENPALEPISVSENNTALEPVEPVSVNTDETTTDSTENSTIENPDSNETETPDSNDTESPDSNDTLPDNIPNVIENPKTVRYYERPDFDIPENDFEATGISNFVVNNSNYETTDNSNFETTDNSFLETTDIRSTIFETTDSSTFETTFDVRNFSTTPSENIETPEKKCEVGPQNEVNKLLQLKNDLINEIKIKRDKLDSLKRIMAYKQEHNLEDLRKTTLQFKYTLQEALVDLLSHLKTHTERNFNMGLLLGFLKIPNEMVGYNEETMCFE